jgi:hypothetical protein
MLNGSALLIQRHTVDKLECGARTRIEARQVDPVAEDRIRCVNDGVRRIEIRPLSLHAERAPSCFPLQRENERPDEREILGSEDRYSWSRGDEPELLNGSAPPCGGCAWFPAHSGLPGRRAARLWDNHPLPCGRRDETKPSSSSILMTSRIYGRQTLDSLDQRLATLATPSTSLSHLVRRPPKRGIGAACDAPRRLIRKQAPPVWRTARRGFRFAIEPPCHSPEHGAAPDHVPRMTPSSPNRSSNSRTRMRPASDVTRGPWNSTFRKPLNVS